MLHLSEPFFVVSRDTRGDVGVLDEACCHRGASLHFGRVEDCGIRRLNPGWKLAVEGTILDTPNLPDARLRGRLEAPAFPAHEAAEVVFAHLGPPDKPEKLRRSSRVAGATGVSGAGDRWQDLLV